jgi:glycosyltransferase involved in cell wall biosynthesis
MNKLISIVIPTFNEEGNVKNLHQKLKEVEKKYNLNFEIIFVNDGSDDKTLEKLNKLSDLKIVNFRKNFGQTAAMDAGIKNSTGEVIITMDADLQNDPEDIPKLLNKLEEGYDVVAGWRYERKDDFMKNFVSRGANRLRSLLVQDGIHDSGCTLKAFRKECFDNLDLYGEMHRFIPGLLKIKGFRVTEIKVKHHPRRAGKTKYGPKRILKGFLDMLSIWFWRKYSSRPLHLFGAAGIGFIILSLIGAGYAFYLKYQLGIDLSDHAITILSAFGLLMGIQLFISGLLADILIKNYYSEREETPYSIKEVVER